VVGYDARRILAGEVPYRDFRSFQGPLAASVHAALYRVTGPSQLASRLFGVCAAALLAVLVWLTLGVFELRPAWRVAGALSSALPVIAIWPYPSPHVPAVAATVGALYLARRRSRAGWIAAGALVVLAGLLQPPIGLAAALGLFAMWLIARVPWRWPLFGALPLVAVALGALAISGALGAAFDNLLWPLLHYNTQRGGFNDTLFGEGAIVAIRAHAESGGTLGAAGTSIVVCCVLTAIALAAPLTAIVVLLSKRRHQAGERALTSGLAVSAALCGAIQVYQRADVAHLSYAAALALPACLALDPSWPRWLRIAGRSLSALALAGTLVLLLADQARARFLPRFDAEAARSPIVTLLRDLTREGDRIAVLPAGGFFYAYARPAAIRYSWLFQPSARFHTAADYQRAAGDIERTPARLVAFVLGEASARDFLTAPPLADVLARRYRRVPAPGGLIVYTLH
jgi:hypothetical protein